MRAALALACALALVGGVEGARQSSARSAQAPPAPVASSKVWLGHEAQYEGFLLTAAIEREEKIPVGVTSPRKVYFAPGGLAAAAVFKPLRPGRSKGGFFESYKAEIAAYELDKVLGLGMVPPTVERTFKQQVGSLQLWVEHVTRLQDKDPNLAPDIQAWNRQVHRQRVWDALTANIDRNAGNLLVDPAWNLILIDHSRGFTRETSFPFPITRIDRALYAKLQALDEATLRQRLGPLLFDGPKPLLERRELILRRIDEMVQEKGEASVFLP